MASVVGSDDGRSDAALVEAVDTASRNCTQRLRQILLPQPMADRRHFTIDEEDPRRCRIVGEIRRRLVE